MGKEQNQPVKRQCHLRTFMVSLKFVEIRPDSCNVFFKIYIPFKFFETKGSVASHSFAGIGASPGAKISGRHRDKRGENANDEISMVDDEFFEEFEAVRRNDKPLGGIQLILCGYFLQFSPVMKASSQSETNIAVVSFSNGDMTTRDIVFVRTGAKDRQKQKDFEFVRFLYFTRFGSVNYGIAMRLLCRFILF